MQSAMSDTNSIIDNNRSKIYEKLDYNPQPAGYDSKIPWIVQQQISATNGIHYMNRVGKLKEYPVYELPVPPVSNNGLFLDIGNGWGRWLIAAANKGYLPIGIDIRLEFAVTARQVMKDMGKHGYTVVADLENIPFQNDIFDLIWSFSVIQHTHYDRLTNCLSHINRLLSKDGFTYLEFPNRNGIHNRMGNVQEMDKTKDDYNSWCVRYYTPQQYKEIFNKYLDKFSYDNHSFLGIGVLKDDLKYVSFKTKLMCMASLAGSALTHVIPGLKNISDSLYIRAFKRGGATQSSADKIAAFRKLHAQNPDDNLNIYPLLRCPKTGGNITISTDRKRAVSQCRRRPYLGERNGRAAEL